MLSMPAVLIVSLLRGFCADGLGALVDWLGWLDSSKALELPCAAEAAADGTSWPVATPCTYNKIIAEVA